MALLDLGGRRLVLASASSRRSDLLHSVGLEFEVIPADIDESTRSGESPTEYVARLSREKAAKVSASEPDAIVIAADTTVDADSQILEKPADDSDLRRMLGLLSGRTHHVHTGVTVTDPSGEVSRGAGSGGTLMSRGAGSGGTLVVTTAVTFTVLSARDVEWYVATGDGFDKAGGYGIRERRERSSNGWRAAPPT